LQWNQKVRKYYRHFEEIGYFGIGPLFDISYFSIPLEPLSAHLAQTTDRDNGGVLLDLGSHGQAPNQNQERTKGT
jgi:hypothetical protein